jgi:hypothetical protein
VGNIFKKVGKGIKQAADWTGDRVHDGGTSLARRLTANVAKRTEKKYHLERGTFNGALASKEFQTIYDKTGSNVRDWARDTVISVASLGVGSAINAAAQAGQGVNAGIQGAKAAKLALTAAKVAKGIETGTKVLKVATAAAGAFTAVKALSQSAMPSPVIPVTDPGTAQVVSGGGSSNLPLLAGVGLLALKLLK